MASKVIRLCYLTIFIVIVYLSLISRLDFYIHPRYIVFTAIFAGIGIVLTLFARSQSFKLSRTSFLLVGIVAFVAIALPPATLSSRQALFREGDQQFTQSTAEFSSYDLQSRDLSRFDIADWVNLLQTNPEPSTVVGSSVDVSGFFLLSDNTGSIARFRVSCCAIDASPLVLNLDRSDLNVDEWYEITGVLEHDEESSEFYVRVENVNEIEVPNDPYVY